MKQEGNIYAARTMQYRVTVVYVLGWSVSQCMSRFKCFHNKTNMEQNQNKHNFLEKEMLFELGH